MAYRVSRNNEGPVFETNPAKSTDISSRAQVKRFSKWLRNPFIHENSEIRANSIKSYGTVEKFVDERNTTLCRAISAYLLVMLPDQSKFGDRSVVFYDLIAECMRGDKFMVEKLNKKIYFYSAASFNTTVSSLIGGLNRVMHLKHKKFIEGRTRDRRWKKSRQIKIATNDFIYLNAIRYKIINVLHDYRMVLSVDENGNHKGPQQKKILEPSTLQEIHHNMPKLMEPPISPKDILCTIYWLSFLRRFQRAGSELRMYLRDHIVPVKAIGSTPAHYRVLYPKGQKNTKFKHNKRTRNRIEYIVLPGQPLYQAFNYYFATLGPHIKERALYLQPHEGFIV